VEEGRADQPMTVASYGPRGYVLMAHLSKTHLATGGQGPPAKAQGSRRRPPPKHWPLMIGAGVQALLEKRLPRWQPSVGALHQQQRRHASLGAAPNRVRNSSALPFFLRGIFPPANTRVRAHSRSKG